MGLFKKFGGWVKETAKEAVDMHKGVVSAGSSLVQNTVANGLDPKNLAVLGTLTGALTGGSAAGSLIKTLPSGGAGSAAATDAANPLASILTPSGGAGSAALTNSIIKSIVETSAPTHQAVRTGAANPAATEVAITLPEVNTTAPRPTVWVRIKDWVSTGYNWGWVAGGVVLVLSGVWWLWQRGTSSFSPKKGKGKAS